MSHFQSSEKRKLESGEEVGTNKKKQATEAPMIPPITVTLQCPHNKVPALIGKKGYVISEIIRRSKCVTIHIDQNVPEGQPSNIQITGVPAAFATAANIISQLIAATTEEQYTELLKSLLGITIQPDLFVPCDKVGGIIGPRGQTINEIMRRSKCSIQIVQDGQPVGLDRLVTFEGSDACIAVAKELIEKVMREGSATLLHDAPPSAANGGKGEEEEITQNKVSLVIGPKGANVALIQKHSGANVLINQTTSPMKIIYTGSKAQIASAKAMIATLINYGLEALNESLSSAMKVPLKNQVIQEINVFLSQIVRLLGPQGSNISLVQSQCGVKIDVDSTAVMPAVGMNIGPSGRPESVNKVTVVGSIEGVNSAVTMLYQFIGIVYTPQPVTEVMSQVQQTHQVMHVAHFSSPQPVIQQKSDQRGNQSGVQRGDNSSSGSERDNMRTEQQSYEEISRDLGAPSQKKRLLEPKSEVVMSVGSGNHRLQLGANGTSGYLDVAIQQADGSLQQVAELKNNAIGRLAGRNNANLTLISVKSGAAVSVLKADNRKGTTRVVLSGAASMVWLAAQMIQEVLVRGTLKLTQMLDVPSEANGNMPGYVASGLPEHGYDQQQLPPQQQQQQQQQQLPQDIQEQGQTQEASAAYGQAHLQPIAYSAPAVTLLPSYLQLPSVPVQQPLVAAAPMTLTAAAPEDPQLAYFRQHQQYQTWPTSQCQPAANHAVPVVQQQYAWALQPATPVQQHQQYQQPVYQQQQQAPVAYGQAALVQQQVQPVFAQPTYIQQQPQAQVAPQAAQQRQQAPFGSQLVQPMSIQEQIAAQVALQQAVQQEATKAAQQQNAYAQQQLQYALQQQQQRQHQLQQPAPVPMSYSAAAYGQQALPQQCGQHQLAQGLQSFGALQQQQPQWSGMQNANIGVQFTPFATPQQQEQRTQPQAQQQPQAAQQKAVQHGAVKEVCYDFQRGECSRGSECRFDHDAAPASGNGSGAAGRGRRGDGPSNGGVRSGGGGRGGGRGGAAQSSRGGRNCGLCYAFQKGVCDKGNSCRFSHSK